MTVLEQMGEKAKNAERILSSSSSSVKNAALSFIADALISHSPEILAANETDLENGRETGLSDAFLDRLKLDSKRLEGMAKGIREIVALPDPVGRAIDGVTRPNGLQIIKTTVPLGVIGIIYEARPNVTSDAAALCLKSGNAVILRGGKEAINSNKAIACVMRNALEKSGLPADCIQLVEDTSRDSSNEMMHLSDYIDVLIPRGGKGLIRAVVKNSTVPVIETGSGNCHTYIDKSADIDMAANIVFNAKTSRVSVCNACESLLVHKDIAKRVLPAIKARLDEKEVEMRGDETSCEILPDIKSATDEDWATEYLDYIISVKIVGSVEEAISHINRYGTGHSECIVTNDYASSQKFLKEVDAAAVYVNASTRFTDGGEFGLGAEIGISTQKLHARGPMGLAALTSIKYMVYGSGQIR